MKKSSKIIALTVTLFCLLAFGGQRPADSAPKLPAIDVWCSPASIPEELLVLDTGWPTDMAAADLDGDSCIEILLAVQHVEGQTGDWVSQLIRISDPLSREDLRTQTLAEENGNELPWGITARQQGFVSPIEVGDLDGDDLDDIAFLIQHATDAQDEFVSDLFIVLGSPTEQFETHRIPLDLGFFAHAQIRLVDTNSDGELDIVVPDPLNQRLLLLSGFESGKYEFLKEIPMPEWGLIPLTVEVADMTGDMVNDIVIGGFALQDSGTLRRFILTAEGTAEREFEMGFPIYIGWEEPTLLRASIAVQDVDQNGLPDIVATVRTDVRDGISDATPSWPAEESFVFLRQSEVGGFYEEQVGWVAKGGPIDIEWAASDSSGFRLLLNVPDGGVRYFEITDEAGERDCQILHPQAERSVIADLDGDSWIEIAIAARRETNSTTLWIYDPLDEESCE